MSLNETIQLSYARPWPETREAVEREPVGDLKEFLIKRTFEEVVYDLTEAKKMLESRGSDLPSLAPDTILKAGLLGIGMRDVVVINPSGETAIEIPTEEQIDPTKNNGSTGYRSLFAHLTKLYLSEVAGYGGAGEYLTGIWEGMLGERKYAELIDFIEGAFRGKLEIDHHQQRRFIYLIASMRVLQELDEQEVHYCD